MGVKDDVQITMSAKDAGMVAAWLEAKKGPEQMGEAMDKMGRKGKAANDSLGASMTAMVGKWTSIAGAIAIAQKALDFYMQSNQRAIQEGKLATQTIDESFRRLMVQADLRSAGITQSQLKQSVIRSATAQAVPIPFANAAATQAISSGFNAKDILQGGGLDSFLQFANATNSTDQDPAQLVKSIGLFLGSTGQDLTSANMRRTMVGVQRLFKGTNMQASALPFLAREGSQITDFGGLSGDDTLSIASVLLNSLGEEKAATAFRGTITDMAMLGKDQTKVQGLGRMGLKPTDVDMVGESFSQALERINSAANKLDPATRNIVMGQIFKTESLPGVMALMSDKGRAQVATNRALMGDEGGFMSDVSIATSGPAAEMRRNDARRMAAMDARGFGAAAVANDAMAVRSIEAGDAAVTTAAKEIIAGTAAGAGVGGGLAAGIGNSIGGYGAAMAGGRAFGLAGMAAAGTYEAGRQVFEFIFRDDDNRALPMEQRGKGIEGQGR